MATEVRQTHRVLPGKLLSALTNKLDTVHVIAFYHEAESSL